MKVKRSIQTVDHLVTSEHKLSLDGFPDGAGANIQIEILAGTGTTTHVSKTISGTLHPSMSILSLLTPSTASTNTYSTPIRMPSYSVTILSFSNVGTNQIQKVALF